MDVSSIATIIVSAVSPLLVKGGEELFKGAGKELWDVIKEQFSGDRDEKTLTDFTDNPSDLKNQGKIELKIAEKLDDDKDFLAQVTRLLDEIEGFKADVYVSTIKQTHTGTGDNVGRDKIQN